MNWYKQVKYAATPIDVSLTGTLKSNKGYIYLSVDNRIITPFLNMIDSDAVISPKEVTEKEKDVGAHISVIKKNETNKEITELGQEFSFTVTGLQSVKPDGWEEVRKVYFLTVDSPELEDLRTKYDLPKKVEGHDFHITVGVEI